MDGISVRTVAERSVRAVVTRADGRVENLGLIAFTSQNRFRRWGYRLGRLIGIWRR
jgi:hypothetical protein